MKRLFFAVLALIGLTANAQPTLQPVNNQNRVLPWAHYESPAPLGTFKAANNGPDDLYVKKIHIFLMPNDGNSTPAITDGLVGSFVIVHFGDDSYGASAQAVPGGVIAEIDLEPHPVLIQEGEQEYLTVRGVFSTVATDLVYNIRANVRIEYEYPDTAGSTANNGNYVWTLDALSAHKTSVDLEVELTFPEETMLVDLGKITVHNRLNPALTGYSTYIPTAGLTALSVELQGNVNGQIPETPGTYVVLDEQGTNIPLTGYTDDSYLDNAVSLLFAEQLILQPGDSVVLTVKKLMTVRPGDNVSAKMRAVGIMSDFNDFYGTVHSSSPDMPTLGRLVTFVQPTITGVAETTDKVAFKAFPNPTTGYQTIKTKDQVTISVYDMTGKNVLSQTVQPNGQLDVTSLSAGMYAMQAVGENGKVIARNTFLKQ